MQAEMKTDPEYLQNREPQTGQPLFFSFPLPRLWVVVLVLALPFIIVSGKYLEVLERTGTPGALIADMTMSAIIAGFPVLLWVLKKRKL